MGKKRADKAPGHSREEPARIQANNRKERLTASTRDQGEVRPTGPTEVDSAELKLALAQLPGRLREAAEAFRELTGFTAVTSFRGPGTRPGSTAAISPPMHPLCASRLRSTRAAPPCEGQWQEHLQAAAQDRSAQDHVCPLGLRCSCVPIYYGEALAGVAKCVAGPGTTDRQFPLAIRILELTVSNACRDFRNSALSAQIEALRGRVSELQRIRLGTGSATSHLKSADTVDAPSTSAQAGRSIVERALDYIAQHYTEHGLSLAAISRALEVNGKYLTLLFTQVVGQHMRAHIVQVRIQHACRLILSTDKPLKQVASESGFGRTDVFRRAFQQYVGVAPGTYRRAFLRP